MPYAVEVDKDVCISSGLCVAEAPAWFRFDDDELAELTTEQPDLPDPALLDLARGCPSGAIALRDEQGGEVELF